MGVCAFGVTFLLLQIVTFNYGRDQGIYSVVARTVLEGGMPYRDAWDFKPPGVFLVFALARAVFGDAQIGIRLLEAGGLLLTILGMMRLADEQWGDRRIGLVAGAVAALAHAQLDFWHTAQPESFGGMLTIGALLLITSGERRGREGDIKKASLALFAAGVVFGAAGLLKPPLAGGGAVAALILFARGVRSAKGEAAGRRLSVLDVTRALRPVALIAAGGALPIALCLAWFAARGALSDLYRVLFVFTPHYTAIGWEGANPFGMTYFGFTEWFIQYTSVVPVGLLLLVGFGLSPREKPFAWMLIGVIIIHIIGVVMQGKFFPYHYGATWPVTSLLAGLGIWKLWARTGQRSPSLAALFALGMTTVALCRSSTKDVPGSFLRRTIDRTALFTVGPRDQDAIDFLASVADVNAKANREVAELIAARTPPGRPIYIWGFEPVLYDLSRRASSSRYIYNVAQRVAWAKVTARDELMRDIKARPPSAIVVEHNDVFPMVTGDVLDSAKAMDDFKALRDLIDERYELSATIEDFDIYLER